MVSGGPSERRIKRWLGFTCGALLISCQNLLRRDSILLSTCVSFGLGLEENMVARSTHFLAVKRTNCGEISMCSLLGATTNVRRAVPHRSMGSRSRIIAQALPVSLNSLSTSSGGHIDGGEPGCRTACALTISNDDGHSIGMASNLIEKQSASLSASWVLPFSLQRTMGVG